MPVESVSEVGHVIAYHSTVSVHIEDTVAVYVHESEVAGTSVVKVRICTEFFFVFEYTVLYEQVVTSDRLAYFCDVVSMIY